MRIVFVGASYSATDALRSEPLTGPNGAIFRDVVLKTLGLDRDAIEVAVAVPRLLLDSKGRPRDPTAAERAEHREQLAKSIGGLDAFVIALGTEAEQAVVEACSARPGFVLPHPTSIRLRKQDGKSDAALRARIERLGHLLQIAKSANRDPATQPKPHNAPARAAQSKDDGENGRSINIAQPYSGPSPQAPADQSGEIRGEDRAAAQQREIDNAGFELDLEFEGDYAVSEDRKSIKFGSAKLDLAAPLPENQALAVGRYSIPSIGADSTADKASRLNSLQVQLAGDVLTGRYSIAPAPGFGSGSSARWNFAPIEAAEADQRPNADQRAKTAKHLVRTRARLCKADSERQIVYAAVLDPYKFDAHSDWVPPAHVEQAAHDWFAKSRVINFGHVLKSDSVPVESWIVHYPSEGDYRAAMNGEPHKALRMQFGDDVVHSGTWMLGVRLGDEEWAIYKSGEIDAFSVEGEGYRTPVGDGSLPKVTFVDLVSSVPKQPDEMTER